MSDSVSKFFENATSTNDVNTDPIVDTVMYKYRSRSYLGIDKYGTTLEDSKEDKIAFINHLQQELMDATLYCEKLLKLLDDAN